MQTADRNAILSAFVILRSITVFGKLVPFICAAGTLLALSVYVVAPEEAAIIFDPILYVSPLSVVLMLVMNRILKLCAWHRTECLILLVPPALAVMDDCLHFSLQIWYLNSCILFALLLVSIIAAYNVFFRR